MVIQWLTKFLLIVLFAKLSTCFRFFPENVFLGAPITNDEIDNMLREEAEEERKGKKRNVFTRSSIPGGKGDALSKEEEQSINEFYAQISMLNIDNSGKRTIEYNCFEKSEEDGSDVYTANKGEKCRHSVDTVLMDKGGGNTLEDLTGSYFNGLTYVVLSFKETDGKLSSIVAEAPVSVDLLKLTLGSEKDPSNLTLDLGEWDENGENALSFRSVGITVEGKCKIKMNDKVLPYNIEFKIEKPADSNLYDIKRFDFTGGPVKWIDLITKAAQEMSLDNLDIVSKIGEMLVQGFTGFGAFNENQDYQFAIVAQGSMVRKIGGAKKLTILLSQNHLQTSQDITIFLLFDEQTQLISGIAHLISDSGLDNIFLLNKIRTKTWCVLVVKGTTTYMKPIISNVEECLGSGKDTLVTGVHFYVEIDFKEVLVECGNAREDVEAISSDVGIYATINKKGVKINLPKGVEVPLEFLLKCGGAIAKKIPDFLGTSTVKLLDIDMNTKERLLKMGLQVTLSDEYNTIPGTSIALNRFVLNAERKIDEETGDKYWDVSATALIRVGQANFELSVEKIKKQLVLRLSTDQFTLADILSTFNSNASSAELQRDVYKSLGIKDFSVQWVSGGDGPKTLNMRGTPLIYGYDGLHFNALIQIGRSARKRRSTAENDLSYYLKHPKVTRARRVRRASSTKFAVAVFLDGANFDSIVSTFTGNEDTSLCWLSGLKAIAVVSNACGKVTNGESEAEEDELELSFPTLGDDFAEMTFGSGLTFNVVWRIPEVKSECASNVLCEWMVENLGSTFLFTLKGTVTKTSIKIEGRLEGYAVLKKSEDQNELAFTSLELVIDVPSIWIEANMQYKDRTLGAWDRPLFFKGSIKATPTEIMLEFSMENFIYPTPLTEYIAIGNIQLGIGYVFGTPFPSFVFGADFKLGKLDPTTTNDGAISVTGHFGINPGNPGENWFYASVSTLTVGEVCTAFELNCEDVSPLFLESGFPYGMTASFAAQEREEATIGTIPEGLAIKGTINFMGYECVFDLTFSSSIFKLKLEMSPLSWSGGLIQVLRSADDSDNGPLADIMIKPNEFSVQIEGYCSFFNTVTLGVKIDINERELHFEIEGFLIPDILEVYIKIDATYGGSPDMGFSFVATLKSNEDFQRILLKAILDFLKEIKERVQEALDRSRATLERAKEKVRIAKKKVEDWKGSIDDWKKKLELRKAELQEEADKSPPCDCPKVCFPFLDWNPKCWQMWGDWMGCPCTNPCYSMVEDVGCYIRCTANKIVSTLVKWAKQAVLEITMLVADGAKALGSLATGVLAIGEGLIYAAQKGVDLVEKGIKWALDASDQYMREVLANFVIYHLTISASITSESGACVGYDVALFVTSNITSSGQACLDGKKFMGSIVGGSLDGPDAPDDLKSPDGKSLSSTDETVNEVQGMMDAQRETEKQLEEEEEKVSGKVSEETAKEFKDAPTRDEIPSSREWKPILDKLPKLHSVPSKEEMEIIRLVHEPIASYVMSGDPDLRSFGTHAPWTLLNTNKQPLGYNATASPGDEIEKELEFDEKLSPCKRMKRALKGYSQLADGLIIHTDSLKDGANDIITGRNADNEYLRSTHNKIEASVRQHNMTIHQRENAYYLYRKAAKGYGELDKKSKIIIQREDSFALPVIRRQLNNMLNKKKGSTFLEFTEHMHTNAVRGYKRSGVSHPSHHAKGEKLLSAIKKELQSIVTDELSGLMSMTNRIKHVKKNINAMKLYTKQCKN